MGLIRDPPHLLATRGTYVVDKVSLAGNSDHDLLPFDMRTLIDSIGTATFQG